MVAETAATPSAGGRTMAQRERRFALMLLAPALLILVLTTTVPLVSAMDGEGLDALWKMIASLPRQTAA